MPMCVGIPKYYPLNAQWSYGMVRDVIARFLGISTALPWLFLKKVYILMDTLSYCVKPEWILMLGSVLVVFVLGLDPYVVMSSSSSEVRNQTIIDCMLPWFLLCTKYLYFLIPLAS